MTTNTDPVRALIGEMTEYLDQQVDPELDVIAKWRDRLEAALAHQPAAPSDETLRLAGVIADKIEDGTLFQAGIFPRRDLADKIRAVVRFTADLRRAALSQPPAAPSAGQATGITAAELGYALKRATPAQVIEYLEDDANMRAALSIHFEEQHDQQPAPPSAPVGVEDGPIDASDNAEYIEHCADMLERCGLRVTAGALRVIAHEHRALAQQPAGVDEAPTWSRQQPTVPGIYGIRGFNLCRPASEQFEAVVVVREHGGELVCNLHESTSEDDLGSWNPICDLDPDFEWRVFVSGWEQHGGRADG